MRIVVDTNVVISSIFFNGNPRRIIEAIVRSELDAFATPEIIQEYRELVARICERGDSICFHQTNLTRKPPPLQVAG